jgi:hypothetical protein
MSEQKKEEATTEPEAKREGREGVDPESQPGEYFDDMRVNRFTPPPDPPAGREKSSRP